MPTPWKHRHVCKSTHLRRFLASSSAGQFFCTFSKSAIIEHQLRYVRERSKWSEGSYVEVAALVVNARAVKSKTPSKWSQQILERVRGVGKESQTRTHGSKSWIFCWKEEEFRSWEFSLLEKEVRSWWKRTWKKWTSVKKKIKKIKNWGYNPFWVQWVDISGCEPDSY